ncbi:hypothetical protein ASG31_03990 [Chryseobacterium sp. Leaf404]|uniref:hypothetical protein n=1 Tax=unclassified Chryseobacterium TaxID=2593645 RepID=UPI0006F61EED|nr:MULTISPECIES: hypothetical protein [unclassified Chryseobacterium]KQT17908.1 hypothetical protein ASG31_03990 [Chryseobacterium sp. Leaf404]
MKAYNTSSYPVFEADQVLSQKDLNLAVSHLEEQDRITRKNLTGIGISCGLELNFPVKNQVKISCGSAVTSLGFQISWNEKLLTHYKETQLSDLFLTPDYKEEAYLDNIFKHSKNYHALKKIYELMPSESSDEEKIIIQNDFFDEKLIILLLEITLVDEKNCVTTNCDDKGKRLEFNLRPIAVSESDFSSQLFPRYPSCNFSPLVFPRYNVPFNDILSPEKVLENFVTPFSTAFFKNISDAVAKIYSEYKAITGQSLNILNDCKSVLEKNLKSYKGTTNVQYFWDWISDIISAYSEIKAHSKNDFSICCADDGLFPFHVVLGGNNEESLSYRTPFFAAGNSSQSMKSKEEIKILFEKLAHIISSFKVGKNLPVRITPSQFGSSKLSEKSLPYYYDDILTLRDHWNPKLTMEKQSDSVLSYHSLHHLYTSKNEVKTPLLFELEDYSFFRIEGHIGKNYQDALSEILKIQQTHQLPFKVMALNAVQFADLPLHLATDDTDWGYLELDYDLVRRNWENVIGKIIEWLEFNQETIRGNRYIKDQKFFDQYVRYLKKGRNFMNESLTSFLKTYHQFIPVYEKIEELSVTLREAVLNARKEDVRFDEDLIDHLDEVIMVCEKGEFRALFQATQEKWKELGKRLSLQRFIEKNPGIDHKAGVTRGGTFILVYKENPPAKKRSFRFTDLKNTEPVRDRTAALDEVTVVGNLQSKATHVNYSNFIENSVQKMQNYITYYHPEIALDLNKYLTYYFNPNILLPVQDSIADKTVIADFYIPYICCGDGDAISFVLGREKEPEPEPEPDPEPKNGDFDYPDFNSEDFNTNR